MVRDELVAQSAAAGLLTAIRAAMPSTATGIKPAPSAPNLGCVVPGIRAREVHPAFATAAREGDDAGLAKEGDLQDRCDSAMF